MSIQIKLNRKLSKWLSVILSTIIVGVSTAALVSTLNELVFDGSPKRDNKNTISQYEKEFFTTTNQLINNQDSVRISIETIKKIFNSIDRKSEGKLFNYGFVNVLEDYSVYLITDTTQRNQENFRLIISLINEELKGEPFNQLKAEQKRILLNLQYALTNKDVETGIYNLNELNDILRIQNEYGAKLEKQNGWSIPLAIVGIVLSLFFGIISLVKSISKKDNNAS